ncbi:methyltransferase domain-containing protein [Candidatus Kaiserbacteria bacterium]|nr:methyltransferase domain-containing protein [Candidatus Kaiserbacteria bacterium]
MKHRILFHGRHILHTRFQEQALSALVQEMAFSSDSPVEVIFAVTSANHANSRYNPVAFHYRAIGIDLFARKVLGPLGARWSIVPIPHMPPTEHFAQRVIAYVHAMHEDGSDISPENTTVLCSTAPLIKQFRAAGYDVATAEYDEATQTYKAPTPQSILAEHAVHVVEGRNTPSFVETVSQATIDLWNTYPEIPQEIERLWNESLLTEYGDITETRDYGTYSFSMSRSDVIDRKYEDIKAGIVPGVIVDEGCADGALLTKVTKEYPDSDLIGIEITREFLAEAHERQRRGEFGSSFVFFHQRNLAHKIFDEASVDTTICNSTTHEIWSYGGGDETLRQYLAYKYAQLKPGGALVIRDVIGPENGDEEIYAWFEDAAGDTPAPEEAPGRDAHTLSTRGRFYKFAKEFFNGRGVKYNEETIDGKKLVRASRKDIADFLGKKNYVDNWDSELHESFTHWSFGRWKEELERAGFSLDTALSYAYTNDWIVEHHLKGTAELFTKKGDSLEAESWPPTNVILVARK